MTDTVRDIFLFLQTLPNVLKFIASLVCVVPIYVMWVQPFPPKPISAGDSPSTQAKPAVTNSIGSIHGNSGIVTQGQTGNNTEHR